MHLAAFIKYMEIKFKLSGLTCEACVKISKKRIEKIGGVQGVEIDLSSGDVKLTSEREIKIEEIRDAFSGLEFKVLQY